MPFEKLIEFEKRISDLPDKPNTQLTAEELKAYFDSSPDEVRVYLNNLIDSLREMDASEQIGVTPFDNSPDILQHVLEWLKLQIDGVALGSVPDKSIGKVKLDFAAVDEEELSTYVEKEINNLLKEINKPKTFSAVRRALASQTIPNGVLTKVSFEQLIKDTLEEVSITQSRFTAKEKGLYVFNVNGILETTKSFFVEIRVNDISTDMYFGKLGIIKVGSVDSSTFSGTYHYELEAGDRVEFFIKQDSGISSYLGDFYAQIVRIR